MRDRGLPLEGRKGRVPKCPVPLGAAGMRWWRWAWGTPQATTWNDSFIEALGLRAHLQDLFESPETETREILRLVPHMARLDEQFGLTARAAMMMHLYFEDAEHPGELPANVTNMPSTTERLKGIAGA